ncbi:MAG: hypothetical protein ACJAXY_002116 [Nonlabens sp.]|jgi:hypothetical protein
MTLKEYIHHLHDFVANNPEALKLPVIYAKDSEGNGFEPLGCIPTLGEHYMDEFNDASKTPNAVCIN